MNNYNGLIKTLLAQLLTRASSLCSFAHTHRVSSWSYFWQVVLSPPADIRPHWTPLGTCAGRRWPWPWATCLSPPCCLCCCSWLTGLAWPGSHDVITTVLPARPAQTHGWPGLGYVWCRSSSVRSSREIQRPTFPRHFSLWQGEDWGLDNTDVTCPALLVPHQDSETHRLLTPALLLNN